MEKLAALGAKGCALAPLRKADRKMAKNFLEQASACKMQTDISV
jgi:hypothetical protein